MAHIPGTFDAIVEVDAATRHREMLRFARHARPQANKPRARLTVVGAGAANVARINPLFDTRVTELQYVAVPPPTLSIPGILGDKADAQFVFTSDDASPTERIFALRVRPIHASSQRARRLTRRTTRDDARGRTFHT